MPRDDTYTALESLEAILSAVPVQELITWMLSSMRNRASTLIAAGAVIHAGGVCPPGVTPDELAEGTVRLLGAISSLAGARDAADARAVHHAVLAAKEEFAACAELTAALRADGWLDLNRERIELSRPEIEIH